MMWIEIFACVLFIVFVIFLIADRCSVQHQFGVYDRCLNETLKTMQDMHERIMALEERNR